MPVTRSEISLDIGSPSFRSVADRSKVGRFFSDARRNCFGGLLLGPFAVHKRTQSFAEFEGAGRHETVILRLQTGGALSCY
ncbi:hypothetical protein RHECNPAF_25300126 [Rhizobium etli CNPAF512]|nr:hypothetical protein RHECNPAF_25300126 [Rhizobium etli CNPAF512]